MQIEEGKFYRTRDGRKVGPMAWEGPSSHPWAEKDDISTHVWRIDGTSRFESDPDLIAEWSDTPTLLGDMTDAEIGALVRAQIGGKTIQRWDSVWEDDDYPDWYFEKAYRVKPEPVRETVTIYINEKGETAPRDDTTSWAATRAITFDKIDGKIDDSTPPKMEPVKW